jgi:hypothetical protein
MNTQEQIDELRARIERLESNRSEKPNSCEQYELPDFVPDWKDAPVQAVCVTMDKNGMWYWWQQKPTANLVDEGEWNTSHILSGIEHGLAGDDWNPGQCTNATRIHPDYWKQSLQERPAKTEPDYTHLLPDGYEFCAEQDAEKWVKVEYSANHRSELDEYNLGYVINVNPNFLIGTWKPIRPIQYHIAVHEAVTAQPDPYQVDWSNAPEWAVGHAYDKSELGYWYKIIFDKTDTLFTQMSERSNLRLPSGLDWKKSLRVNPKLK